MRNPWGLVGAIVACPQVKSFKGGLGMAVQEPRILIDGLTLGQSLFEEINRHLESPRRPSSTKNRAGDRATKKGNEWHFGMNGTQAETGVVHSVTTTPANVHDVTEAHRLLHGREKSMRGTSTSVRRTHWQVAMRPGRRRQLGQRRWLAEKHKASIRAKAGACTSSGLWVRQDPVPRAG